MKRDIRDNILIFALLAVMFIGMNVAECRRVSHCAAADGFTLQDIKTSEAPSVAAFISADSEETRATASEDDTPGDSERPYVHPLARFAPTKDFTVEPYGLVSYDTGLKTPRWVLHELTEESVDPTGPATRPGAFHADESIDSRWRTHPDWFTNSGYDRGHCAPCASFKYSQSVTNACMSLKNIMVQAKELNEHEWASLEVLERTLTQDGHTVFDVTGPAWKSDGKPVVSTKVVHGMLVGTHCFKALMIEKGRVRECMAWLAPNRNDAPRMDAWRISTDELEEVLGFDLWPAPPGLDDEDRAKWNKEQEKLEARK